MKYTVQQDCAGWVVIAESKPRRAVKHFAVNERKKAQKLALFLSAETMAELQSVPVTSGDRFDEQV